MGTGGRSGSAVSRADMGRSRGGGNAQLQQHKIKLSSKAIHGVFAKQCLEQTQTNGLCTGGSLMGF